MPLLWLCSRASDFFFFCCTSSFAFLCKWLRKGIISDGDQFQWTPSQEAGGEVLLNNNSLPPSVNELFFHMPVNRRLGDFTMFCLVFGTFLDNYSVAAYVCKLRYHVQLTLTKGRHLIVGSGVCSLSKCVSLCGWNFRDASWFSGIKKISGVITWVRR